MFLDLEPLFATSNHPSIKSRAIGTSTSSGLDDDPNPSSQAFIDPPTASQVNNDPTARGLSEVQNVSFAPQGSTTNENQDAGDSEFVVVRNPTLSHFNKLNLDPPFNGSRPMPTLDSPAGVLTVAFSPLAVEGLKFVLWDIGSKAFLAAVDKVSELVKTKENDELQRFYHQCVPAVDDLDQVMKDWRAWCESHKDQDEVKKFGSFMLGDDKTWRLDDLNTKLNSLSDYRLKDEDDQSFMRVWNKANKDGLKPEFKKTTSDKVDEYKTKTQAISTYIQQHCSLMTSASPALGTGQSGIDAANAQLQSVRNMFQDVPVTDHSNQMN